jgi:hypothetical protein
MAAITFSDLTNEFENYLQFIDVDVLTVNNILYLTSQSNQISFGPNNQVTLNVNTPFTRTYTLADAGANANFVMTEGNQTINGSKTFTSTVLTDGVTSRSTNTNLTLEGNGTGIVYVNDSLKVENDIITDSIKQKTTTITVTGTSNDPLVRFRSSGSNNDTSIRVSNASDDRENVIGLTSGSGSFVISGFGSSIQAGDAVLCSKGAFQKLHIATQIGPSAKIPHITFDWQDPLIRLNNQTRIYNTNDTTANGTGCLILDGGLSVSKKAWINDSLTCNTIQSQNNTNLTLQAQGAGVIIANGKLIAGSNLNTLSDANDSLYLEGPSGNYSQMHIVNANNGTPINAYVSVNKNGMGSGITGYTSAGMNIWTNSAHDIRIAANHEKPVIIDAATNSLSIGNELKIRKTTNQIYFNDIGGLQKRTILKVDPTAAPNDITYTLLDVSQNCNILTDRGPYEIYDPWTIYTQWTFNANQLMNNNLTVNGSLITNSIKQNGTLLITSNNNTTNPLVKISAGNITTCFQVANQSSTIEIDIEATIPSGRIANGGGSVVTNNDCLIGIREQRRLHFATSYHSSAQVPIMTFDSYAEPKIRCNNMVRIWEDTESTSTSSGCLIANGGIGCAKNIYVGGSVNTNTINALSGTITVQGVTNFDPIMRLVGNGNNTFCSFRVGNNTSNQIELAITSGTGVYVKNGLGTTVSANDCVLDARLATQRIHFAIGSGVTSQVPHITLDTTEPKVRINNRIRCYDTTESTSLTTGSVITDGGAAITKNLYVGGDCNVTGNISGAAVKTDFAYFVSVNEMRYTGNFSYVRVGGFADWSIEKGSGISTDYVTIYIPALYRTTANKGFKLTSFKLAYTIDNDNLTGSTVTLYKVQLQDSAIATNTSWNKTAIGLSSNSLDNAFSSLRKYRTYNVTSPEFITSDYFWVIDVGVTTKLTTLFRIYGCTLYFTTDYL